MSVFHDLTSACIAQSASRVFKSISEIYLLADEIPVFLTVRNYLIQNGQLPHAETLLQLGISLPVVQGHAAHYLDQLRQRAAYGVVQQQYSIMNAALRNRDIPSVISAMRECVNRASNLTSNQTYASVNEVTEAIEQDYAAARLSLGRLRGITSGYPTIDATLGGFTGSDIIVVAGRPGAGKSLTLLTMADAAWNSGANVAFVTMEMSNLENGIRWASIRTGINPDWISKGELPNWAETVLRNETQRMRDYGSAVPLNFLSGDFAKNVEGVEEFILAHSPDILFIDAVYLLTASGRAKGYIPKWENISHVIGQLKQMAIRYNIPIVVSVQLNRNAKNDQQKDLDLSDISGSDSIPQDASAVYGIRLGLPPNEKTQRYLQCLKNRRGRGADLQTNFNFSPTNFREILELSELNTSNGADFSGMV